MTPSFRDLESARAADRLLRSGSCLSRAVTIAARLQGADIVIGIDPWHSKSAETRAHAWVELAGERLRPNEGRQFVFGEILRLGPEEGGQQVSR
jgi:hypothetical protein